MPERHIFFIPLQKRLRKSVACTFIYIKESRQPVLPAPFSISRLLSPYSSTGPSPIQLVVLSAVRNAVSAATITFTVSSMIRFFVMFCGFFVCLRNLGI